MPTTYTIDLSACCCGVNCPDGYPTTLYLSYSCSLCDCLNGQSYAVTGPTLQSPGIYRWGITPSTTCGFGNGDFVLLNCDTGAWTNSYTHLTGTVVSSNPLIVTFAGSINPSGVGPCPHATCTVTLSE